MPRNNHLSVLHYAMAIFIAMILSIVQWADIVCLLAPDWVLLVLLHWSLSTTNELSITKVWSLSLLMDVLMGQVLGQYVLSYALSIFLAKQQYKRINVMPLFQQSFLIACLLFLARLVMFCIEKGSNVSVPIYFWSPVLTGGVVWFMMLFLFRPLRFQ